MMGVLIRKDYGNASKVYCINILYFNIGSGDDYVYSGQTDFKGIHTGNTLVLSERDRKILKMNTPEEISPEYFLLLLNEFNKEATTPLEEWLDYLKNKRVRPDTTTPGLREVYEKLRYIQMNYNDRKAYDRYLDNLRNEEDCLESAKIEGYAEGRVIGREEGLAQVKLIRKEEGLAEGIQKGKDEAVKTMALRMLENGSEPGFVSGVTGMSLEEISKLKP